MDVGVQQVSSAPLTENDSWEKKPVYDYQKILHSLASPLTFRPREPYYCVDQTNNRMMSYSKNGRGHGSGYGYRHHVHSDDMYHDRGYAPWPESQIHGQREKRRRLEQR